jgi:hypothetical protein
VRWIAHGVLFVAQAASLGCYTQLYRRVLRPGADGKRKARDGAAWLTALQALFSSDQEVFPVRRNILWTAARPPIQR